MNKIKDIELEILELGQQPDLSKLHDLIEQMDSYVNRYSLIHPLLEPENLRKSIDQFSNKTRNRGITELECLEDFTRRYSESCTNFILKSVDKYWDYIPNRNTKDIEGRILECFELLREEFSIRHVRLNNVGSLHSIAKADPQFIPFTDSPIDDEELDAYINELGSAPKRIAILQMMGLIPDVNNPELFNVPCLKRLIVSITRKNGENRENEEEKIEKVLYGLRIQMNGGTTRNTAFKESQKSFIEDTVKFLVSCGFDEDEVRNRIPKLIKGTNN